VSFTVEVVTGLAELLAAGGVGSWLTSGSYAADATAIVVGRLPLKPVMAVGLTPYAVPGAANWLVQVTGVQLRFRAATDTGVLDLQDAAFDLLHYRGLTSLGGHMITDMWRQAATPPGSLGTSDLPELADSYYLITDR
jgi:bifunctional ADP-heptose synthase (sugar kinase/adenylyltransferase)